MQNDINLVRTTKILAKWLPNSGRMHFPFWVGRLSETLSVPDEVYDAVVEAYQPLGRDVLELEPYHHRVQNH